MEGERRDAYRSVDRRSVRAVRRAHQGNRSGVWRPDSRPDSGGPRDQSRGTLPGAHVRRVDVFHVLPPQWEDGREPLRTGRATGGTEHGERPSRWVRCGPRRSGNHRETAAERAARERRRVASVVARDGSDSVARQRAAGSADSGFSRRDRVRRRPTSGSASSRTPIRGRSSGLTGRKSRRSTPTLTAGAKGNSSRCKRPTKR